MYKKHTRTKRLISFIIPHLILLIFLYGFDFINHKAYGDYDPGWGVLAINTNKSYYLPDEKAHLEFAVLDSNGMMICDANLLLEIAKENGEDDDILDVLKTSDGSIIVNPDCHFKANYKNPDFEASYSFKNIGTYNLTLTAETKNGVYKANKRVEITNNIPIVVERKSYTRIFPVNTHRTDMIITPSKDFKGVVEEIAPLDLNILESSLFNIELVDETKQKISWEIDWKAGKTYELFYYFDTPHKSPEFYSIEPLQIKEEQNIFKKILKIDNVVYRELDGWQIASDDILNRYASSCTGGWNDITNGQGAPDLSSTAVFSSFTTSNSANDMVSDQLDMDCSGFDNRDLGSFTSANIVFSFATDGAGNNDDYIDINYIVGVTTYDITTIIQDAVKSNSTNGGYWSYSAPNITSWADVGNTTVEFNNIKLANPGRDYAYVDAVWIEIDYTPRTYTQNDFEWYAPQGSVTLTNIWPTAGGDDLTENEVFTQFPASNEAMKSGDQIRLQMNFTVGAANLPTTIEAFKLQYVAAEDCTTASGWADVGAKASGTIWRLYDEASLADAVTQVDQISTSNLGAEGYFSETVNTGDNPNAVNSTQNTEWDWPLENNGATDNTTYCFRMAVDDEVVTFAYNSDGYPKLTTAPGATNLMRHGNIFQSDTERGFFWAN